MSYLFKFLLVYIFSLILGILLAKLYKDKNAGISAFIPIVNTFMCILFTILIPWLLLDKHGYIEKYRKWIER